MIILITSVLYQFVIISLIEYFFREEEITITDYEKFEKIETYKRLMNKITDADILNILKNKIEVYEKDLV